MLHTKYQSFFGFAVFDKKIFFQDFPFGTATRILNGMEFFEHLWLSFMQVTTLWSFVEIGPVV